MSTLRELSTPNETSQSGSHIGHTILVSYSETYMLLKPLDITLKAYVCFEVGTVDLIDALCQNNDHMN